MVFRALGEEGYTIFSKNIHQRFFGSMFYMFIIL